MLRGSADLEDVLASAYFQVWRELQRFDAQRGSAVTWLLTIVRSRALDTLRESAAARTAGRRKRKPSCRARRPAPTSCCKASKPARACARSSRT